MRKMRGAEVYGRLFAAICKGAAMTSTRFKTWTGILDERTCVDCKNKQGTVYDRGRRIVPWPPLHMHCRCAIARLKAVAAGTATDRGMDGADWWLQYMDALPDYYITMDEAEAAGWNRKRGDLHLKCPEKMIDGGEYENKDGHLPTAAGRKWYEADINYRQGHRGTDRIVYSNDGLVFVTYDHYRTFYEVVKEAKQQ